MDIATLTEFFKCCTIINLLFLLMSAIVSTTGLAYNIHSKLGFWEGSEEAHKQMMYSLLGNFKILWLVFNFVPYIVLCCYM